MIHSAARKLIIFFIGFLLYSALFAASTAGAKNNPEPDLVINSVQLDKSCSVTVELQNTGKGEIDSKSFKEIVLGLKMGNTTKTIDVPAHDKQARLCKPGGSIMVKTGLVVKTASAIHARIDIKNTVSESNEANNTNTTKVVPTCKNKKGKDSSANGKQQEKQKGAGAAKGDDNNSGSNSGLLFKIPEPGSIHFAGKILEARLEFTNPSDISPYQLFLLRNGSRLFKFPDSVLPPPGQSSNFAVPLPGNLPSGDNYQLEALAAGGNLHARSYPFIVKKQTQEHSDGLQIRIAGNPSQIGIQETISMTMTVTDSDADPFYPLSNWQNHYGEFLFYIAAHSMPNPGAMPSWWLSRAWENATLSPDRRTMTMQVVLPPDIPEGNNYRFCYFRQNNSGSGESPSFSIVRNDAALTQLTVLTGHFFSPHWTRFSQQRIEWQIEAPQGATIPSTWLIEFLASTGTGTEFPIFSLNSSVNSFESIEENGIIRKKFRHPYTVGQFLPGPYHIKISSAGIEARTVYPVIFEITPTPPDTVNMNLTNLKVNEEGQLQVYIITTPPSGGRGPSGYDAVFSIFRGDGSAPLNVVNRSIPAHGTLTTQGWISLGHISSFSSSASLLSDRMTIRVEMNLSETSDYDADDNSISKDVKIRENRIHVSFRGTDYEASTNTLYFLGEGYRQTENFELRAFSIAVTNMGYSTVSGQMFVYQTKNHRPGEMAQPGPGPQVDLGSKPIIIPPSESLAFQPVSIPLFFSGVSRPEWYIGQIIIEMTGDLDDDLNLPPGIPREGPYIYVNFDYRRKD